MSYLSDAQQVALSGCIAAQIVSDHNRTRREKSGPIQERVSALGSTSLVNTVQFCSQA